MIKLNGPIGKPYVDAIKPRQGQIILPSRYLNSSGVDAAIWFSNGYCYQALNPAIGDTFIFEFMKHGSETKIYLMMSKRSNRPIVNIYVNDILEISAVDLYSATDSTYVLEFIPTAILNVNAINTMKIVSTGKNESSIAVLIGTYGMRYY